MLCRVVSGVLSFEQYKILIEIMLYDKCYRTSGTAVEENFDSSKIAPDVMSFCTNDAGQELIRDFNICKGNLTIAFKETSEYIPAIARYALYSLGLMTKADASDQIGTRNKKSDIYEIVNYMANTIIDIYETHEDNKKYQKMIKEDREILDVLSVLASDLPENKQLVDVVIDKIFDVFKGTSDTMSFEQYLADYLKNGSLQRMYFNTVIAKHDFVLQWFQYQEHVPYALIFSDTNSKYYFENAYSIARQMIANAPDKFLDDDSYAAQNNTFNKIRSMTGAKFAAKPAHEITAVANKIFGGEFANTTINDGSDNELDTADKYNSLSDKSDRHSIKNIGEKLSSVRKSEINEKLNSYNTVTFIEYLQQLYATKYINKFTSLYKNFIKEYTEDSTNMNNSPDISFICLDYFRQPANYVAMDQGYSSICPSPAFFKRVGLVTQWHPIDNIHIVSKNDENVNRRTVQSYNAIYRNRNNITKNNLLQNCIPSKATLVTKDKVCGLTAIAISHVVKNQGNIFNKDLHGPIINRLTNIMSRSIIEAITNSIPEAEKTQSLCANINSFVTKIINSKTPYRRRVLDVASKLTINKDFIVSPNPTWSTTDSCSMLYDFLIMLGTSNAYREDGDLAKVLTDYFSALCKSYNPELLKYLKLSGSDVGNISSNIYNCISELCSNQDIVQFYESGMPFDVTRNVKLQDLYGYAILYGQFKDQFHENMVTIRDDSVVSTLNIVHSISAMDDITNCLSRFGLSIMDLPSTQDMREVDENLVCQDLTTAKSVLNVRRKLRAGLYDISSLSNNIYNNKMFTNVSLTLDILREDFDNTDTELSKVSRDTPAVSFDKNSDILFERIAGTPEASSKVDIKKDKRKARMAIVDAANISREFNRDDLSRLELRSQAIDTLTSGLNSLSYINKNPYEKQSFIEAEIRKQISKIVFRKDHRLIDNYHAANEPQNTKLVPTNQHMIHSTAGKNMFNLDNYTVLGLMLWGYKPELSEYSKGAEINDPIVNKAMLYKVYDSLNYVGLTDLIQEALTYKESTPDRTYEFISTENTVVMKPIDRAKSLKDLDNLASRGIQDIAGKIRSKAAINNSSKVQAVYKLIESLVSNDILQANSEFNLTERETSDLQRQFKLISEIPILSNTTSNNIENREKIIDSILTSIDSPLDAIYLVGMLTYIDGIPDFILGTDSEGTIKGLINGLKLAIHNLSTKVNKFNNLNKKMMHIYREVLENTSMVSRNVINELKPTEFDSVISVVGDSSNQYISYANLDDILVTLSIVQNTILLIGYLSMSDSLICGGNGIYGVIYNKDFTPKVSIDNTIWTEEVKPKPIIIKQINGTGENSILHASLLGNLQNKYTKFTFGNSSFINHIKDYIRKLDVNDIHKLGICNDIIANSKRLPVMVPNVELAGKDMVYKFQCGGNVLGFISDMFSVFPADIVNDFAKFKDIAMGHPDFGKYMTATSFFMAINKTKFEYSENQNSTGLFNGLMTALIKDIYKLALSTYCKGLNLPEISDKWLNGCPKINRNVIFGFLSEDKVYFASPSIRELFTNPEKNQMTVNLSLNMLARNTISLTKEEASRSLMSVKEYAPNSELCKILVADRTKSELLGLNMLETCAIIQINGANVVVKNSDSGRFLVMRDKRIVDLAAHVTKSVFSLTNNSSAVMNTIAVSNNTTNPAIAVIINNIQKEVDSRFMEDMKILQHLRYFVSVVTGNNVRTEGQEVNGAYLKARLYIISTIMISSLYSKYKTIVQLMNTSKYIIDKLKAPLSNAKIDASLYRDIIRDCSRRMAICGIDVSHMFKYSGTLETAESLYDVMYILYTVSNAIYNLHMSAHLPEFDKYYGSTLEMITKAFDTALPLNEMSQTMMNSLKVWFSNHEEIMLEAYNREISKFSSNIYNSGSIRVSPVWGAVCEKYYSPDNDLTYWNGLELLLYKGQRVFPNAKGEFNRIYLKNGMCITVITGMNEDYIEETSVEVYDAAENENLERLLNM